MANQNTPITVAHGDGIGPEIMAATLHILKAAGARLVIVNAEPTPFDDLADAVLSRPIGEVLPALCAPDA